MVTACIVGDVINANQNYVAAINTEGWLFIFYLSSRDAAAKRMEHGEPPTQTTKESQPITTRLESFYEQRMPANCKELLLADLDGDGQNEVIIGLTDRVLRTYKWIKIGQGRGKFVGLYKWEFADQIGAVSLNPSRHKNCQDIIVAQPGGTYAKLECYDKKPLLEDGEDESPKSIQQQQSTDSNAHSPENETNDSPNDNSTQQGDNVRTEYINKLTPEYHQLALSQMRNHHVSTEALGGIRHGKSSELYNLIVIATLDGTLMLVNKDEILWSLQVDHQLFALAVIDQNKDTLDYDHPVLPQSESSCTIVPNLDSTNSRSHIDDIRNKPAKTKHSQYFVACAWNGKTYIIDEERNYLRFKFDEAVSAFTAGNYYFDGSNHASLVYATFNNQIILYFDVILDYIQPIYLLNELTKNPDNENLLEKIESLPRRESDGSDGTEVYNSLRDILYNYVE